MKEKDWTNTPSFPAPAGGKGEMKWVQPEKYFDQLPQILKDVPARPGEEALYAMMQSVLDAAKDDPQVKDALVETAISTEQELIAPLLQFRNNGRAVGNGWTSPPNGARWGFDYLSRAASARSNMYDNAPEETRYIYTDFDTDGQRLNGDHAYVVTFPKGQTPPVDGFWSMTLYNSEHLFAANPMNRYSLGTKNMKSLKLGDDGSLTLYVQNAPPQKDREANWLPSPEGEDFSLYIRAYWPKQEILDETWMPPKVERRKD